MALRSFLNSRRGQSFATKSCGPWKESTDIYVDKGWGIVDELKEKVIKLVVEEKYVTQANR